jgi:hypothetical protein
MRVMYEMESLRNTSKLRVETAPECNCHDKRALEVALVWMTTLERVRIEVCSCNPAPDQLLHAGLFACAPVLPSLAVDIGLLDSAMRLFVNMPPNNTAWCNTLEAFLKSRSYKLMTQVCSLMPQDVIDGLTLLPGCIAQTFWQRAEMVHQPTSDHSG